MPGDPGSGGVKRARDVTFAAALLGPAAILYLAFLMAPVGFFLAISFLKYSPAELFILEFTLENYTRLLFDAYYQNSIIQTFRIAGIVTAITLVLAYVVAFYLARMKSAMRGVLMFLVVAPLMTGIIVRTYGWIVLLGNDGLINSVLVWTGFVDAPLQLLHREMTVIVALVHIMLPYMVFPIFSSLVSQDPHIVPAASTLGARPLRAFVEVTLPLSLPGMVMGAALVFTMTAGSVVTAELLGGREVSMMGQAIYQLILTVFNWPLGASVAALLVLTQFIVIFVYFRRTRRAD